MKPALNKDKLFPRKYIHNSLRDRHPGESFSIISTSDGAPGWYGFRFFLTLKWAESSKRLLEEDDNEGLPSKKQRVESLTPMEEDFPFAIDHPQHPSLPREEKTRLSESVLSFEAFKNLSSHLKLSEEEQVSHFKTLEKNKLLFKVFPSLNSFSLAF